MAARVFILGTLFASVVTYACNDEDKQRCLRKYYPEDTCYAAPDAASCTKIFGCSWGKNCGALACDPASTAGAAGMAGAAGADPLCLEQQRISCSKYIDSECASHANCAWGDGCHGTPTLVCESLSTQAECNGYSICTWAGTTQ